jgi:hypothetical protein
MNRMRRIDVARLPHTATVQARPMVEQPPTGDKPRKDQWPIGPFHAQELALSTGPRRVASCHEYSVSMPRFS